MSLTTKIVLGIVAGIATGLFLGELASPLAIAGNAFIGLLQMTVLPYIVVSLVANIGRIRWSERRGMLLAATAVLGTLLGIGVLTLLFAPLSLPRFETASFFSSSLVEVPRALDFVALYVPSNPFGSLANNVVPAVVLFSILLGMGVSGVPGNEGLLRALDVVATALNNINKGVIRFTPVGVFAIAAGSSGTISLEELSRLQAYVLTYTAIALYLTFVLLPLLVSAVTPFRYRELLSIPKNTLITIFAAAKIIVVLPQLIEDIKELFRQHGLADDDVESGADILLPLAYPFPNLGTYTILVFVPFAAWYLGRSLDPSDQLLFQAASLLSSFVAPVIGIPFLLDLMNLPSDMMELFVVSTVYTDRIRVVLGAMHLIALTVIVLAIVRGVFRIDLKKLARAGALCAVLAIAMTIGVRTLLVATTQRYTAGDTLVQMHWMDNSVENVVIRSELPEPDPRLQRSPGHSQGRGASRNQMARILERGSIRVGYLPDSLPFAFVSASNSLVGFDIEMAHYLARDLEVGLEIVRLDRDRISEALEAGQIDLLMSGMAMTPGRIAEWDFPASPMDLTLAFLVRDADRGEFRTLRNVLRQETFRVGVVQHGQAFRALLAHHFPNAQTVPIESPRAFLRGKRNDLDAVVYSAEGGSAWTLIYPDFTVALPTPLSLKVPMGYPIAKGESAFRVFLSEWIRLKQKDGTVDALFEHWILGGGAKPKTHRWSVIRDVLGWVE